MAKKFGFKEKYADKLEKEPLRDFLKQNFSEEEMNDFYGANGKEGIFKSLNKLLIEIYGIKNLADIYMESECFDKDNMHYDIKGLIKKKMKEAFDMYLSYENFSNTYVIFLWDVLSLILYAHRIKKKDRKIIRRENENKYYILNPNDKINEELLGAYRYKSIKNTYQLSSYFNWLYEIKLEDNSEVRNFIGKGTRKNHAPEVLLGELLVFEEELKEFECYTIEENTNVFLAWELYSTFEELLEKSRDEEIFKLVTELALELGKIYCVEVRSQLIYIIAEIVEVIKRDEKCDMGEALKQMILEIQKRQEKFNSDYKKVLRELLYIYKEEENWKKLLWIQEYNTEYFNRLWNQVKILKDNINNGDRISYLQLQFEDLWYSDNKTKKYQWFRCIWRSLQGDKMC